ncbi:MAG: DnaD domain protein [Eubacterium sp.]|nr:DnaD domain protein [Eubacterium sp.]
MSKITLHSNYSNAYTNVPNVFIDCYMNSANGEFVKVYLYLLRHMDSPEQNFSISKIADHFNHTENDITRALKYWESVNLLRLEYDAEQHLTGICFLNYDSLPETRCHSTSGINAENTLSAGNTEIISPAGNAQNIITADKPSAPEKTTYSRDEIAAFRKNNEICELLYIAETYLGRTLNTTDCQTLFYLYDRLQFSSDLIEYLIEYCVVKGHTSIRYIEKTGLAWHEQNIHTVEEAKELNRLHSKSHTAVMKAFGIKGRNLVKPEQEFIQKWTGSYGFSSDMITEACCRTISAIHQPSFEYADKILQNWRRNHVQYPKDIARLDSLHKQQPGGFAARPAAQTANGNKFNNFTQRNYNYDQLEKQLARQ